MACHMLGAKSLLELMLISCQLDPKEHISEMALKIQKFSLKKMLLKILSQPQCVKIFEH